MITLLTMGAGNVLALKKTLASFKDVCNEFVYGDLLLFPEDREIVKSYQQQFNLKIIPFNFDYLFQHGFSSLLNKLATHATNDIVIYMNTSEAIDEDYGMLDIVKNNTECNAFYFTHRTDPHRWYRCYNRHELKWSGMLHEQLIGEYRPYHKPIIMMKDLDKDMDNTFKAKVFDTVKEIVYFTNYMSFIDNPSLLGATDQGWVKFATDSYQSFKDRLEKKGAAYQAFKDGDLEAFMEYVHNSPEFEKEKFESNLSIEFQVDPMFLGKK